MANDNQEIRRARKIAAETEAAGGSPWNAVEAIVRDCDLSMLRAQRIVHRLTLAEVVDRLKEILRENGVSCGGPTHQSVSRWEMSPDPPTHQYLDALCRLYRTRPDRLGFGHDYSPVEETGKTAEPSVFQLRPALARPVLQVFKEIGSAVAVPGRSVASAAEVAELEDSTERGGYLLYSLTPGEFIDDRMQDFKQANSILLADGLTAGLRRRLNRVVAKNAGFIAFTFNDISDFTHTVSWHQMSLQAARRAEDQGIEAWIIGHSAYMHACHRVSLSQGLGAARYAQAASGGKPTSAKVFGLLAEANLQARLGQQVEAMRLLREADRLFAALPSSATADDGIGTSEYRLRWQQAETLSTLGRRDLAEAARDRALELPKASQDLTGWALLEIDRAILLLREEAVADAAALLGAVWRELPDGLRKGQVPMRIMRIVNGAKPSVREALLREEPTLPGGRVAGRARQNGDIG
ncbi:hypothetical protein [Actinospica robiniae]|uniref:hypothetical protein n=1 Tax=Actinospica robiniae TaxID=304901 RepID=UPI00040B360A|nr:hypothetical protein [Actinospica robiniae]